jgi:ammonia channel protein AmtB
MHRPLISPRIILALIATILFLPITICVVFGMAALLAAMGDYAGGAVLHRIALGCGILWVIDLICLVLASAIGSLRGPDDE